MAGDSARAAVPETQRFIKKVELNAGDEDRPHRHERDQLGRTREPERNHDAFVLAEQATDALQRRRVDVPGVARDVLDAVDVAVEGRVETVVHAGGQPQGDVAAVAVPIDQAGVGQQLVQRVRQPLGLNEIGALQATEWSHDAVARAGDHIGPCIDGSDAVLELAGEAVVEAAELTLARFVQLRIAGEELPRRNRQIPNERLLDLGQPAHQAGQRATRNPVRQQKVDVLLLKHLTNG